MAIETLNAWVIHKRASGETSLWVTFFTREKGLLTCLAKGGRTPKRHAFLESFQCLSIIVDRRKNNFYLREATPIDPSLLSPEGKSLFISFYINELVYHLVSIGDSCPMLFDAYEQVMHTIQLAQESSAVEAFLRRFEWILLINCGYSISLSSEAHSDQPITENQRYQFIVNEGFIPSEQGPISGGDLILLAQDQLNTISVLRVAKFIMRQGIDYLLEGKILTSRTLFRKT